MKLMDAIFIGYAVKNKERCMEQRYKEVYFHKYCNTCKYEKVKETESPCNECIEEPFNLYSHKPVNYEDKNKKE